VNRGRNATFGDEGILNNDSAVSESSNEYYRGREFQAAVKIK
jgi:hypothetical protein